MAWWSSKIDVTFIDDATGSTIAVTKMPPNQLPESFQIATTMNIGNDQWSVMSAAPMTRDEFAKTKRLTLHLRRITTLPAGDIAFSLPTICDAIPATGNHPLTGTEFIIGDDDWRQFELVSRVLQAEIAEEIAAIRLIHENFKAKHGWTKIHVRAKAENPVIAEITLPELERAMQAGALRGVAYRGAASQIADGYAFSLDECVTVYGIAPHGRVQTIAFDQYSNSSPSPAAIEKLSSFAKQHDLDIVYWSRCLHLTPNDERFGSLFN